MRAAQPLVGSPGGDALAAGISERSNFGCRKLDRAYFFAAGGEDERTRSAAVRTRGNGVRFRVKGASERLTEKRAMFTA